MRTRGAIAVYDYLDYRRYLHDYYAEQTKNGRLSYRAFSQRASLKSTNYLRLVIKGERNLTEGMAARFATACRLTGDAATYFCDLVAFNQATTSAERNRSYARLAGSHKYRAAHPLDHAQLAFYSRWYIPVVRELVALPDFREDAEWIGKQILPPIAKSEAAEALSTLLKLGLLVRDEAGALKQTNTVVSTGPETSRMHVVNYHRAMMERAAESVDLVPAAERDISALTLHVEEAKFDEVKSLVRRFRQELLAITVEPGKASRIVQLNLQLFPLTKKGATP